MSEPRILNIEDLQPTDTLRADSFTSLESLTVKQIQNLSLPQVWKTNLGFLISDGNHRTTILAKKGQKQIKVDYNEPQNVFEYETEFLETIEHRAKELQNQGIYTSMDLLQT